MDHYLFTAIAIGIVALAATVLGYKWNAEEPPATLLQVEVAIPL